MSIIYITQLFLAIEFILLAIETELVNNIYMNIDFKCIL